MLLAIREGDQLVEEDPAGAVSDSSGTPQSDHGSRWPIDGAPRSGTPASIQREIVHVRDWANDASRCLPRRSQADVDDSKASLVVPMLRHGVAVGIVGSMGPTRGRPDKDAQVALRDVRQPGGDRGRQRPPAATRSKLVTATSPSRWSCRRRPARCCVSSATTRATCPP